MTDVLGTSGGPLLLATLMAPWLALAVFPALPRRYGAALLPLAALPALVLALTGSELTFETTVTVSTGQIFGLDATGRIFLLPAALVWAAAGWQAMTGASPPGQRLSFAAPWCLALAGSLTLILTQDLLGFYTAMAVMTFASWGLIVHSRSRSARAAGRLYLVMMMFGEVAMFTGVAIVMVATPSAPIPGFAAAAEAGPVALALLGLGFATKLGVLGLHAWLPLAHPAAPSAASAVLSGVMIKAGLLGWWRITEPAAGAYPALGMALVGIGLAAAFYGVLRGLPRDNAKTILAWSSVSQMGLVTMLAGATQLSVEAAPMAWAALAVFVVHHGLNKGALFLGAGHRQAAGDSTAATSAWLLLWLPALALAGAPLTAGSLAKNVAEEALQPTPVGDWISAVLYLGTMATTLLMARLLWCTRPDALRFRRRVPPGLVPAATLVVLAAFLPWFWFRDLPAATTALSASGLVGATWPVLLATGVALAAGLGPVGLPRQLWRMRPAWPLLRDWGHHQLVRMAERERKLQHWTTVGWLLLALVVLMTAAVLPASL